MIRKSYPRRSPVKKRKRPQAETTRIYGDAYGDYIRSLPCHFCGRWPSVQAHLKAGGTGYKDNAERTLPMCPTNIAEDHEGCHEKYDARKVSFPKSQGTTRDALFVVAAELYAAFRAYSEEVA